MRSYDPQDKWDAKAAAELQAPAWMLDVLKVNPGYCSWGPHEDYMWNKEGGWTSGVFTDRWADFTLALDDLNEVANFYFSIERDNEECAACGGEGYNPETKRISDSFYRHSCPQGEQPWHDQITQDEVEALISHHRIGVKWNPERREYDRTLPPPTADEVNTAERGRGLGHDAINRGILIEARAKRLGVWGLCPACSGNGYVYTAPACRLALTLWVLHPRKGASRGWEIKSVEESELPAAFAYLRQAAERNAARFASIPAARGETKEG